VVGGGWQVSDKGECAPPGWRGGVEGRVEQGGVEGAAAWGRHCCRCAAQEHGWVVRSRYGSEGMACANVLGWRSPLCFMLREGGCATSSPACCVAQHIKGPGDGSAVVSTGMQWGHQATLGGGAPPTCSRCLVTSMGVRCGASGRGNAATAVGPPTHPLRQRATHLQPLLGHVHGRHDGVVECSGDGTRPARDERVMPRLVAARHILDGFVHRELEGVCGPAGVRTERALLSVTALG